MKYIGATHRVSLSGEVIETFQKDGKSIAKISVKPFQLEVQFDVLDTSRLDISHLGDAVLLDVTMLVEKIGSGFGSDCAGLLDSESDYFP